MPDHLDRLGSDEYRGHKHHSVGYGHHGHGHYSMYFELAKRIFQKKTS
jgi:hypothetical protein